MMLGLTTHRSRRGVSLVELLIIITIIGILASMAVPKFSDATDQTMHASTLNQLQRLRSQIELYKSNEGNYPDLIASQWSQLTAAGYLRSAPKNPYVPATPTVIAATAAPGVAWVWRVKDGPSSEPLLYAVDAMGAELAEN